MKITAEQNKQIAETILNQLGGNRFLAMTGSYGLGFGESSLYMKLRRNNSGANYLIITLTSMDDYTMEFVSVRNMNRTVKKMVEGVYCDMLQDIFTSVTGLYTKL